MEKITWDRVIEFISLAALIITAWATRNMWLSRRRLDAAGMPTVTLPYGHTVKRGSVPMEIKWKIDPPFDAIWHVTGVTVRPFWRGAIISHWKAKEPIKSGGFSYVPHGWLRKIPYEPGRRDGSFIVLPTASSEFDLVFNLSLRASPSETSRFPVRIRIKD